MIEDDFGPHLIGAKVKLVDSPDEPTGWIPALVDKLGEIVGMSKNDTGDKCYIIRFDEPTNFSGLNELNQILAPYNGQQYWVTNIESVSILGLSKNGVETILRSTD